MPRGASPTFLETVERLPLLHSGVKGSFANESYASRLPNLLRDVVELNRHDLDDAQQTRLLSLADDLVNDGRVPLPSEFPYDQRGPSSEHWQRLLQDKDYTWQNSWWFLNEQYLFHLVLVISGYYSTGFDPFHRSKVKELNESGPWTLLQNAIGVSYKSDGESSAHGQLQRLMKLCLWGNKADGCYQEVKDTVSGVDATLAVEDEYLLVDDSDRTIGHLERLGQEKTHVQFINDNAGTEILLDLALVDHLLTKGWSRKVTLNVKEEPMYVSDATARDVREHIDAMQEEGRTKEIRKLGERLAGYVESERLEVVSDRFWNLYTFYWELPDALFDRLRQEASLVVLKGDLNYRRLLGDRDWPVSTPVEEAMPYFPSPLVCFRTLKSDPIVGIPADTAAQLNEEDPRWRFNGKRGIIQSVL